jgi:hypothetical protein
MTDFGKELNNRVSEGFGREGRIESAGNLRGAARQRVRKPLLCNRIRPSVPLTRLTGKTSLIGSLKDLFDQASRTLKQYLSPLDPAVSLLRLSDLLLRGPVRTVKFVSLDKKYH